VEEYPHTRPCRGFPRTPGKLYRGLMGTLLCEYCGTGFEPWNEWEPAPYCPPCDARDRRLQRSYGLSIGQYEDMSERQEHKCAVCGFARAACPNGLLFVDHDHETGMVRGLLCPPCNTALGLIRDDTRTLQRLIDYLERSQDEVRAILQASPVIRQKSKGQFCV
jgi:Zn finger protein HypA/HybF involved in hydrogenase expression